MLVKALRKEDLAGFIDNLAKAYVVAGPVAKEFKYVFAEVDSSSELALDYNTTLLPPKKYLLPQRETLLSYEMGNKPEVKSVLDKTRRVIFGVHSCDLHGIWLLDDIFAEGSPDAHYLTRRDNTFIVGIDCKSPCWERSFCKSMGTLKPGGGYDLFLTDLGDAYAVQVATRAGEMLLDHGDFAPAAHETKERFYEAWRKKNEEFPDRIEFDTERLPAMLAEAYDDILWDALEETVAAVRAFVER